MKAHRIFSALAGALLLTCATAEPLVTMQGGQAKAGVVTRWEGKGRKVTLSVRDGQADAVAGAIRDQVDGVRVKIVRGAVQVTGVALDALLPRLAEVELGGGDDALNLLAAASTEDDFGSGSSLRAKKKAQLAALLKDQNKLALGRVRAVHQGQFPNVVVEVRLDRAPAGPLGKKIRKGQTIRFQPKFSQKGDHIDWRVAENQWNVGAWHLRAGDRVKVRVGAEQKDGSFAADVITR